MYPLPVVLPSFARTKPESGSPKVGAKEGRLVLSSSLKLTTQFHPDEAVYKCQEQGVAISIFLPERGKVEF